MNKPNYQVGEKVILFEDAPKVAWVTEGYGFGCVCWAETHWEVTITFDAKSDLRNGQHKSAAKIKPFTDDLWAACEAWLAQRTQLAVDYEQLKRRPYVRLREPGRAPWQDLLIGEAI